MLDLDGVYDPCRPNDRLLLGMKGSTPSSNSLMLDAARAKARRGELRIGVPIGYFWHREIGLGFDPDLRIQDAVRLIFSQFRELGSSSSAIRLQRVAACEARLAEMRIPDPTAVAPDFAGLADDLTAAWNAPGVSMRARQRLLRALVTDIIADVDEAAREVILTIHWRGGQHSQLRVRKPQTGEHGCRTPDAALAVMRSMASRWSDEDIAASLNRMGMPTGQGKTWTAHRVSSVRRVNGIHAYRSAEKNGDWLTMSEAAGKLGVTHFRIRSLIKDRVLATEQVVPGAPHQIRACDLEDEPVIAAIGRKGRPCRINLENQLPMFLDT